MVSLSFHEDTGKPLRGHKMTKSSYLPQMTPNKKNKGTLFSSTFKVEDKKVCLFFLFEVNLVRYGDFEILPILPFYAIIYKKMGLEAALPIKLEQKKITHFFHDIFGMGKTS